jgi:MFS transporter, OPA family, glycerol-3-phosphate transporter
VQSDSLLPADEVAPPESGSQPPLTRWHWVTIALLTLGYSGYYFCRSNLSVVLPDLIHDLAQHGISPSEAQIRLGFIASAGTVAYATGKFFSGPTADMWGGRRNFLGGMAGSILFTIVFALSGGVPLFTLAWICNRFSGSFGWAGLVKVSSRWFSYSTYGSVMAVISLSFLFGDAAGRWSMSILMAHGVGWRGVFFAGAAALGALLVTNLILLRETPQERGLPAAEANPLNVFARHEAEHGQGKKQLATILRSLITSFPFLLVCLLSLGTTLLRETFNLWTPTYYVQYVGLSSSQAASRSALFPLVGGVSVLLAGFLSDKLGLNGRNLVTVFGMAACTVCLVMIARTPEHSGEWRAVILVTMAGFLLLGPYSYLAGAMSMDIGGKDGSATAAGIVDGIGYLGGWLSGDTVARITVAFGWKITFLSLAGVSLITVLVAVVLLVHQRDLKPLNAVA